MKYKLIESFMIEYLEDNVNKAISEGWKPIGGIAVSINESLLSKTIVAPGMHLYHYVQAMTKDLD